MQLRVLMLWHKKENSEEEKEINSEQRTASSEHYPSDGAFCSLFFARCS